MMDDKELNRILGRYTVPELDPDLVIQAVHNAITAPQPQRPRRRERKRARVFSFLLKPFPSFVMGGLAAVAAMFLFVLPMLGLQIRHEFNIDTAIKELSAAQQTAANDVATTDRIFSMLQTPQQDDSRQLDNLLQEPPEDPAPIWDTFMGQG